jgi:hypothetical protein
MILVIYCCHFCGLVFVLASHTLSEAMAGCSQTDLVLTSHGTDGSKATILCATYTPLYTIIHQTMAVLFVYEDLVTTRPFLLKILYSLFLQVHNGMLTSKQVFLVATNYLQYPGTSWYLPLLCWNGKVMFVQSFYIYLDWGLQLVGIASWPGACALLWSVHKPVYITQNLANDRFASFLWMRQCKILYIIKWHRNISSCVW